MTAEYSTRPEDFAVLAGGASAMAPAPAPDPEVALMLEVAAGSEAAFTTLVQRHQSSLLNFFLRMGASSDGEDLVQETFVRLFQYRLRYRPAARFSTFLYHIARNAWADRGRKIGRIERLAVGLQQEAGTVRAPSPQGPGRAEDVEAALDRLSPKLREVLVLNIYQGLAYQEVADVLKIPLGTVKSRINLALKALRNLVHED